MTFTMIKPGGGSATNTAKTNSTGQATWTSKLGQNDPTGTYSVTATVASGSQTATSNSVSFAVQ